MVGLLNIDGMNVLDGTDYILQYGKNLSEIESYLAKAAKAQGGVVKMACSLDQIIFHCSRKVFQVYYL
jgi:hypothetical protein